MVAYDPSGGRRRRDWQAEGIRALRRHLGLSQQRMADELGTRQQTVSEWETGLYRPRGASARLLTIIAERAGFEYEAAGRDRKQATGNRKEVRKDAGRDDDSSA
jgi:transcriptional regulator with XRE-family HTH domain